MLQSSLDTSSGFCKTRPVHMSRGHLEACVLRSPSQDKYLTATEAASGSTLPSKQLHVGPLCGCVHPHALLVWPGLGSWVIIGAGHTFGRVCVFLHACVLSLPSMPGLASWVTISGLAWGPG